MLTAVPAEGYLALRQHHIILCAAPIFFQDCVSPARIRGGAFCLPSSARPSLRAREWTPLQRVLLQAAADKKTPTAAAVGFGFNHYWRMLPAHGKADDSAAYRR